MKKKIIGFLLMGAFVMSSTSVFVSCKDYDDDVADLRAQISSLDGTVKQQISKLESAQTALENAYKSGDDAMLAAAKQAVADAKKDLETALATKDQFNSLEVAVIKAQTSVEQALKLIDEKANKSDLTAMQGDVDAAKASLASIKADLSTATSSLTSVQSDLTAAVTRITTMETDVKKALSELTELTTALSGQQAALETVADGASAIKQTIVGLQSRANELEDQMKVLAGLISVGGGTVDISEVTVELSRLRQTVLDLSDQIDPNINTLVVALSKALRSMVFMPTLYLDGIEAIEYPWIGDTILQLDKSITRIADLSHHANVLKDRHDISKDLGDYVPNRLGRWYNVATGQIEKSFGTNNKKYHYDLTSKQLSEKEWIYGPAWEVNYHLNPSTATINYDTNAPSFNVLESEVVYYNTRAAASSLGITSPENFFVNNKAFTFPAAQFGKNSKGELSVGLQIAHPENLAPWPTDGTINPNGYPAGTGNPNDVADNPNPWDNLGDTDGYFGNWYCNKDSHKTHLGRYHYAANNKDNVIALQMHNATSTDEKDMITSDYALLVPTRIQLEGLIWAKRPQYIEPKDQYFKGGPGNLKGDEEGWANFGTASCDKDSVHVWDSPEEALANPYGAALELPCMDPAGVDLTQYLGIHYVKENLLSREYNNDRWQLKTFTYGQEAAFGLHYEFELVDYASSSNQTGDSRYASFSDWVDDGTVITNWNGTTSRTGVIIARNVDPTVNNVKTLVAQSTTAVDREPLVRVLVKNEAGKVLLDGYILLHITYTPNNLVVDNYPEEPETFDGCNEVGLVTTWNQFSNLILHEKLNMNERLAFDNNYWVDCIESSDATYEVIKSDTAYVTHSGVYADTNKAFLTGTAVDGHGQGYQLRLFNFGSDIYGKGKANDDITAVDADGYGLPIEKGSGNQYEENGNDFEQKAAILTDRTTLGNAIYYPNGEGTTNHTFSWYITPDEAEYLTHDENAKNHIVVKDGKQYVKVVRYFRFISKDKSGRDRGVDNYSAPYPYVWVKMTLLIDRKQIATLMYKEKIDNYWYNWNVNGDLTTEQAYNGWSAWLIDIEAPRNGESRRNEQWLARLSNSLLTNRANISQEIKYYFAPKPANGLQITAQNGVTYTITPKNDGTGQYREPDISRNIPAPLGGGTKNYGNGGTWNKMFCKYVWGNRTYINSSSGGSQFIPSFRTVKPLNDNHVWKEDELKATLQNCVIIYDDEVVNGYERNAGVFNDSLLYASYKVGSVDYYTPIARIVQQKQTTSGNNIEAGEIQLIHWLPVGSSWNTPGRVQNVVLYDVLNAMGYPLKADGTCNFDSAHMFINQQLRAWVGVVAKTDCNRAQYVEQEKYDDNNIATFLASWERPINLNLIPDTIALDANTNENYLYMLDHIKLFDWRGDYKHQGYMYDDPNLIRNENHWWFWAYYNVKGIEVDLTSVYTNMHKDLRPANQEWVPLSQVTKQLSLYLLDPLTGEATTSQGKQVYGEGFEIVKGTNYGNDFVNNPWGLVDPNKFNSSDKEADIERYMGLRPVDVAKKSLFGGIYYANNGINVTEFDLVFPLTIFYEWGYLQYKPVIRNGVLEPGSALVWHIDTTHGR